jgi:hypothetical protein
VPWLVRQLGPAKHEAPEDRLVSALEILKELDTALKDTGLEPEQTLGVAVDRLCR